MLNLIQYLVGVDVNGRIHRYRSLNDLRDTCPRSLVASGISVASSMMVTWVALDAKRSVPVSTAP